MDTIKNYLNSLFASLPDSDEVRNAKEELYQMMEDKYFQLKEEGKSENEAIGIVITEFGNIDEIKEELEIENQEFQKNYQTENEGRCVTLSQVREYLEAIQKYSKKVAIGVMLCIFSPATLIFLCGLVEEYQIDEKLAVFIGLMVLFLFIIPAVAIFIYTGNQLTEYEYLKKEIFYIDSSIEGYIREERKKYKSTFAVKITIGVILCILSVIPLLFSAFLLDEFACIVSVCILLIIVGIGVLFFVSGGMVQDSFSVLLQENEYDRSMKNKNLETIGSVYWCLAVAIYLGWSFLTSDWHITWIIWPIAGVLYGAITAIFGRISENTPNS